ncbi:MAG TPA: NAD(P)H-dependent glycerol-3-phosphate dehydrogenase [Armatimonadota bacterium]|nr:NAD(P)H-dependent glycerol-3-phosphate dehydrogenase [Armatimonadota bacterium]
MSLDAENQKVGSLAVLGSGSWGTVLACLFSRRARRVTLWSRSSDSARSIQQTRANDRYLPGFRLPDNIEVTADLCRATTEASIIVIATPSFAVGETCGQIASYIGPDTLVISGAKGLESSTGRRMSEVVEACIPGVGDRLVALSGPNLAREMVADMPTATVVASRTPGPARQIQASLSLPRLRIYTNPDVVGVELGGALKNIVAIAAGITDGLGYGENTKAALMSRGLTEIRRLGRALGAVDATFSGLSGIGDLYATCASNKSRNHKVGFELGRGRKLSEILESMDQISEGVLTTDAALLLASQTGVEMPITRGLHQILFENASPREIVSALMARAHTSEGECEDEG